MGGGDDGFDTGDTGGTRVNTDTHTATYTVPTPGTRVLLDPTSERVPTTQPISPRPAAFDGQTVALVDISKMRGDVFLDRIEQRLHSLGIVTKRFRKPTFTKPAPIDLRHEIATTCTMVIEALAD